MVKFSVVSLALKTITKFSWGHYLEYTTTAIWDELGEFYEIFRLIRIDQAFNPFPMNGSMGGSVSAFVDGQVLSNQLSINERTLSAAIGFYDDPFHCTSCVA